MNVPPASLPSLGPKSLFSLLLEPAKDIKAVFGGMIVALLVLSAAQGLFLLLVGPLFKTMFVQDGAELLRLETLLPKAVLHWWPQGTNLSLDRTQLAQALPGAILLVALIKALATYLFQFQQQYAALYIGRRFRERLFSAVIRLPFSHLVERSPAAWMSAIVNDVNYLQVRISDVFTGLLRDGAVVLASLVALYIIHWPTALVVTLLAVPLARSTGRTGRKISRFAENWQSELGRMAAAILDLRHRFEFIRAQGGETLEQQRFASMNDGYFRMIQRSILLRSAYAPVLELLGFVLFAGLLLAIGQGYLGQDFSTADLLQFFAALGLLLRPLKSLGEQLTRYHETLGVMRRSLETFAAVEAAKRAEPDAPSSTLSLRTMPAVCVQHLRLEYSQGFVLVAENLRLLPGRSVAIIGPSGSGKSSLLKCLGGLLPPQNWVADQDWLLTAQQSTLVSQKPFLFSGSIRDNLVYGLEDSEQNDEGLQDILRLVNLHEELRAMGQSLDTPLDFIQTPLSGGQMQRLTIARALLRPQSLLLFDEVTSAIDPMAEDLITRRLLERVKDRGQSLLFITHRLSHINLFDEIWFCEAGELTVLGHPRSIPQHSRVQRFLQETPPVS